MPVVRTSKGKRDGEDSFQLTWAPPAASDPSEPQKFSFAPNVTPVTFTAPSPADEDDIPSQSTLFPDPAPSPDLRATPGSESPIYQPAPKRRRKTASTKDAELGEDGSVTPEHIPRPPNAFILFRSSFIKSQHVSSAIEGNHGTLSKIVGMVWHNLSFEERQIWQAKAKRALVEHKRRFPEYSFRPSNKDKDRVKAIAGGDDTRSSAARDGSAPPTKRKQRECGPRDEARCEHIASLVAKGLKGQGLEDAVKLFDATRAPAVITPRFEQPITAKQYEGASVKIKVEPREEKMATQQLQQQQSKLPLHRFRRGSSAPLLDSENSETSRRQSFFMPRSASPLQPSPVRPGVDFISSIRSHRKRSASSSPPYRPRMLLPAASLPSMPTYVQNQAPPSLSLSTSMSSAEMSNYASSAPLSAPALSRQPTLIMEQPSPSDYYDYDNSQGAWYDGASGSSPNTASGSEYCYPNTQSWENPSFDFSQFSFSTASSSTPVPVDHSQPESYSPFDTAASSSSSSAVEDYSGMPMLVEPPPQPHPLHIQTNWAQAEYDYGGPSHVYYPPPSASPLDSASASPVKQAYPQALSYSMSDLTVYASPTSPSSASVSDCAATQAHTPREGSAEPAHSVFTPAPDAYGGCGPQQHESAGCYASTQLAYDGGMGGVNVNVSIGMDPSLFQTFYEQTKLGGFNFHPDPYMNGMAQPQVQHAL